MNKARATSFAENRLMAIISARTAQGRLPKIPTLVKPALTQIANAEVSLRDLLRSSLQRGLSGPVQWDHYGIAVEGSRGYLSVVGQILALGYVDSGISFTGAEPACLLLSEKPPTTPIKVVGKAPIAGRTRTKVRLAYLAFDLGGLWRVPNKEPWNDEFNRLVADTGKPVIGQSVLGIDQQGVLLERQDVASWPTTVPKKLLTGFTFPNILILDRSTR